MIETSMKRKRGWGISTVFFNSGDEMLPRVAGLAEELRLDALFLGEGATVYTDPVTNLALLADKTTQVRLGVTTAPGLRHPAVLANTFITLQQVSKGRMILKIGTGDLALIQLGERPIRLAPFGEYVAALRKLMNGEAAQWNGAEIGPLNERF